MRGLNSGLSWRSPAAFRGRERRTADAGERREIGPVDESGTLFESENEPRVSRWPLGSVGSVLPRARWSVAAGAPSTPPAACSPDVWLSLPKPHARASAECRTLAAPVETNARSRRCARSADTCRDPAAWPTFADWGGPDEGQHITPPLRASKPL